MLSGRILAKSLLPEPKTSLKCSLAALVSGNKLRFSKKKITFSGEGTYSIGGIGVTVQIGTLSQ